MPQTNKAWAGILAAFGLGVAFYDPRAAIPVFALAALAWFIGKENGE